MSEDEKTVVVGKATLARAEVKREISLLGSELEKVKAMYRRLETALRQDACLTFDTEQYTGQLPYPGIKLQEYHFESAEIDGAKLKAMYKTLRQKEAELRQLEQQLKDLGA